MNDAKAATPEPEREWEQLSLNEKLNELGFPIRLGDTVLLDKHIPEQSTKRLHAALDQLLDCGGLLTEIEAMTQAFILGRSDKAQPDAEKNAMEILAQIHLLVTAED